MPQGSKPLLGEHDHLTNSGLIAELNVYVLLAGTHSNSRIARQTPWRGGPAQHIGVFVLQLEHHV